jgi:hypothetical protein
VPAKTLVAYYSRSGTTRKLAEGIAESLGADMEEIVEPRDRRSRRGYVRSLLEAFWQRPAPISPAKKDPAAYELVVIGTPVWAASLSSPVRSYLLANKARRRLLLHARRQRQRARLQELTASIGVHDRSGGSGENLLGVLDGADAGDASGPFGKSARCRHVRRQGAAGDGWCFPTGITVLACIPFSPSPS